MNGVTGKAQINHPYELLIHCIVKTVQFDIQSHYCVTATFTGQGSVPSFPLHFYTFQGHKANL